MRIISSFKDYYDIYDPDQEPLYIREEKEEEISYRDCPVDFLPTIENLNSIVVSFCGKLYPYYLYPKYLNRYSSILLGEIEDYIRNTKDADIIRKALNNHFKNNHTISLDLHRKHNSPILSWHRAWRNQIIQTINPNLGRIGFQKLVDPYTAHQEIEMFLSSTLATEKNPIPKRTQELIRDAHGFDKNSFRNTKPDRRKRKQ